MKFLLALCLVISACSSSPKYNVLVTQSEYDKIVREETRKELETDSTWKKLMEGLR